MTAPIYSCGRCHGYWTGLNAAHCSVCHRTFAGLRGFTMPRRNGACTDPVKLGMVERDRSGLPAWGWEMDDAGRERLRLRREAEDA